MPGAAAAAAGAAAASAAASLGAVLAAVVGGIVSFATSYVISSAFGLNKAPKMGDRGGGGVTQRNQDQTISVRQPVAPHRVVYGSIRTGG